MSVIDKIEEALGKEGFEENYTAALKTVGKVKFELFSIFGDLEKAGNKPLMKRIKKMQDEMESISVVIKKNM